MKSISLVRIKIGLRLLRPHQWLKNGFVFVGILFGRQWFNPALWWQVLLAFVAFSLISSAVYIYNDIHDREQDRLHPRKKLRPLASGQIQLPTAITLMGVLLLVAIVLSAVINLNLLALIVIYLLLNTAYTHVLKHTVILDVFAIAGGFMLRILAGTWAIGIPPSQWLLFCGGMLTLLLGFGKRRAEVKRFFPFQSHARRVMRHYSVAFLDGMMSITASCCIVGYGLYAMSAPVISGHYFSGLIYTVPVVAYGIFRYVYCLYNQSPHMAEDPAQLVWQDRPLLLAIITWLLFTIVILAS